MFIRVCVYLSIVRSLQDEHNVNCIKNLPIAFINDNFCDCADCADEQNTSKSRNLVACPLNEKIPGAYVDDGVCDCCDGSDEPRMHCENRCEALAAQHQAQTRRRQEDPDFAIKAARSEITENLRIRNSWDFQLQLLKNKKEAAAVEFKRNPGSETALRLAHIQEQMESVSEQSRIDYGPNDLLVHLYSRCLLHEDKNVMREICFFKRITKVRDWQNVSLGEFSHLDEKNAFIHHFTNGDACHGGRSHSATVFIACGVESRIVKVDTPSACLHIFHVQTPVACLNDHRVNLAQTFRSIKDEL